MLAPVDVSGELSLDETTDPTALVHGDAAVLSELAASLRETGRELDSTGQALRRLDVEGWTGKSGDAYDDARRDTCGDWLRAADAYADAARTLDDYAGTVAWAQGLAADAVALHRGGGGGAWARAEQLLERGRSGRDAAAHRAADVLRRMGEVARTSPRLPAPEVFSKQGGHFRINGQPVRQHLVGGVVAGFAQAVRAVRGINPFDPFMLTHPARFGASRSDAVVGAVAATVHPERVIGGIVADFRRDPAEAAGRPPSTSA